MDGEDVIVLIGGIDGRAALGDVHLFQCSNYSWLHEKATFVHHFTRVCVRARGIAHVLTELYDTYDTQQAKPANVMELRPRSGHTATLVGDSLFVLGGKDDGGVHYAEVAMLDTLTLRWAIPANATTTTTNTGEAPPGLCGHSAVAVGRRIYVIGGRRSDGEPSRRIYILNTGSVFLPRGPAVARYPFGHYVAFV
jgi:hypothetical protein